jgi:hypothetical protein
MFRFFIAMRSIRRDNNFWTYPNHSDYSFNSKFYLVAHLDIHYVLQSCSYGMSLYFSDSFELPLFAMSFIRYLIRVLIRRLNERGSVAVKSVIDDFDFKNFGVNLIRPTKGGYENGEHYLDRVTFSRRGD